MAKYLCGVDLGGTKLSAGLFLPDGTPIETKKIYNHINMDSKGITESIVRMIKDLMNSQKIDDDDLYGIGIGVAGHINYKKGFIITSSNFQASFNNYPLRDEIASHFNTKIYIDNDANAQAYGELCFGAGKKYSNIIFITISTGVGGGIIIDRKLVRGMTGSAGEIGHTIIDPNSKIKCTCGNYGCLMALSSGQALPSLYNKYLDDGIESKLKLNSKTVSKLDGILLKEGISMGDEISIKVLEDSANAIGTGLYNLFQMLNPEIFIIGGGLMNFGNVYLDLIRTRFLSLVKKMMYDNVEVKSSELGYNAGLLGAAALTLDIK
ncbi:MAG: ROK family protein [Spirochaetaceae bacterium]